MTVETMPETDARAERGAPREAGAPCEAGAPYEAARPHGSGTPRGTGRRHEAGSLRDGGQVAGIEVLPFALLVFVVGAMLIANAWAVIDAKMAASAAAREAARAYAEAPAGGGSTGAWQRADRAATTTLASYGIIEGRADAAAVSDPGLQRCGRVVVEVTVRVPAIAVPWVGGFGDRVVRARHGALVDPFRSGLDGGGCA